MSDLIPTMLKLANEQALSLEDQMLLAEAKSALDASYSPYSGFQVAAAIRLVNGPTVTGFNIENASYPVCMCAEQTTIAAVRTQYPGQQIEAMAITVRNKNLKVTEPATPCGQCRQLLFEQERINATPIKLILQGEEGEVWVFNQCADLLPFGFSGDVLS